MNRPIDPLLDALIDGSKRSLHLIDIENLAGSGLLTKNQVLNVSTEYSRQTHCQRKDLFVVAAGPQNRAAVFQGWNFGVPVCSFRKGKDGADLALVGLFESIEHPEAFEHIYLATGDAGLFSIAEKSRALGVELTLVSGRGSKSRRYNSLTTVTLNIGIEK